jgi:hypothetical protein
MIEGEREMILPDICEIVGVVDAQGDSIADMNYIGAQRRDSEYMMNLSH